MAGKIGFFDEVGEMMQEELGQAGKAAKQQVTGKSGQQGNTQNAPQQGQQQPQGQIPQDQGQAIEQGAAQQNQGQTDDIVKQLYGSGDAVSQGEVKAKELEDKQKEEALRQSLHSDYYQNLTNRPKPQEERLGEKVEREEEEKKKMILQEEDKKEKEELPVVATKNMGTSEKLRGVSG